MKKKGKYKSGTQLWTNPITGISSRLSPFMSQWYIYYIQNAPSQDYHFLCKFRRQFRVPYSYFQELSAELKERDEFQPWWTGATDGLGKPSTPINLLVLTALRYIGRAWTLEKLFDVSSTSFKGMRALCSTTDRLFHPQLRKKLAITWQSIQMPVYLGLLALLTPLTYSWSVCHTSIAKSIWALSPHTLQGHTMTVNHRQRILACTEGSPARWNDMTLATFDPFMQGLHEGRILQDVLFSLYAYNSDGEAVQQRYRGGWLLVDNGYLARSTTVPPFKTTNSRAEIRFSTWLESLRKDEKCTFGILKVRWQILKCGIPIHGTDCPDQEFLTCCALHNQLLDIDGLDERWKQGVQSIWSTAYDNDDGETDDMEEDSSLKSEIASVLPDAILRLQNPAAERRYGVSNYERMDQAEDTPAPAVRIDSTTPGADDGNDGIVEVQKLSLNDFRHRLVVHFSIALERNEV
jgi:hypothetical protein